MSTEPVLVFNHIPKCYGQSLRVYFRTFMATHTDYESAFATPEDHRAYPYDISRLAADDLLIGHFTSNAMHLKDRYPEVLENPRFRLFTFVRNPLDRQISQYYYSFRTGRNRKGMTMEEYPLAKALSTASNPIASCFPCDESNYSDTLSRYFFLGVTDRVTESMRVLVERIYRIYAEAPKTRSVVRMLDALERVRSKGLPHENRARRDQQAEKISDDVLDTFRRRNAVDYLIYEKACQCLDADLKELGFA
jgi:hypothetical protein